MSGKSEVEAIYFADPMCSWCWGFAPSAAAIRAQFGDDLPMRLVMGGLRPGTEQPMTGSAKQEVREHWQHVQEASGQPFDFRFFERDGFVYDTDPAARAVVAIRRLDAKFEFPFFECVQRAFYAENRDVTDPEVLSKLAAEVGADHDAFIDLLGSEAVRQDVLREYAFSYRSGVRGFPTLFVGPSSEAAYILATHRYRGPDELLPHVQKILQDLKQHRQEGSSGSSL